MGSKKTYESIAPIKGNGGLHKQLHDLTARVHYHVQQEKVSFLKQRRSTKAELNALTCDCSCDDTNKPNKK